MHTANGKVLPIRIHVGTMKLLNVQNTICRISILLNLIIFKFVWVFGDISNRLVNILSQKWFSWLATYSCARPIARRSVPRKLLNCDVVRAYDTRQLCSCERHRWSAAASCWRRLAVRPYLGILKLDVAIPWVMWDCFGLPLIHARPIDQSRINQ